MTDLQFYLFILFRIIPIILHSLGIYLILNTTFAKPWQKIQKRYMIWLSVSEIIMCICIMLYATGQHYKNMKLPLNIDVVFVFYIGLQFCFVLVSMTIDRVAFVWLNLRYNYVSGGKIFIVVFTCSQLIPFAALASFYFFTQRRGSDFDQFQALYLWPVVDLCILLVFISCYIIMAKAIVKRSKNLFGVESKIYRKRTRKAILVPNLIIWTYIICFVLMDAIYFGLAVSRNPTPQWLDSLSNLFYAMGYNLDAALYIFLISAIRKTLKRKLCCCFQRRIDPNTDSGMT